MCIRDSFGHRRVIDQERLGGVEYASQVGGCVVAHGVEILPGDVDLAAGGKHQLPAVEQHDAGAGKGNESLQLVKDASQHLVKLCLLHTSRCV